MRRIDDPFDAFQSQNPEDPTNPALEIVLRAVAACHPLLGLGEALREHFSTEAKLRRLQELLEVCITEVRRQGKQVEDIQEKLKSPGFKETFIVAATETLQSANSKKIERFALVLGYQLAAPEEESTWEEASAFIRDLAELGEADIAALQILDSVQGDLVGASQTIFDPNPFTERVQALLQEVDRRGIGRDEFYSLCGRLSGFGLALEVMRNIARMAPSEHCFRLTRRGKRLINMLRNTRT
jgi:hypothetical protein